MNAAANKDAFTSVLLYRNRLVITNQHFEFDYKFNGFEMDAETDYVMTIQAEYSPGATGPSVMWYKLLHFQQWNPFKIQPFQEKLLFYE